jgi:hypothetical protein
MARVLAAESFMGNRWGIILGTDEYWILWYIFRSLALLVDRVQGVQYGPDDKHPHCQILRKFANLYTFVQLCIGLTLGYFLIRVFIF